MLKAPNPRNPAVASFLRSLVSGPAKAKLISYEPLPGEKVQECFSIVPKKVAAHGGKERFGWLIFEIKGVWLEAEFHVVWERPDGALVDVTPRKQPLNRHLFLPDAKRVYEGVTVKSVFKALSKDPRIREFFALTDALVSLREEIDEADVAGSIDKSNEALKLKYQMNQLAAEIFEDHRR